MTNELKATKIEFNVLILSCGTRNKIVQYFKREFTKFGKIIAADCSHLAPALYDADKYYVVPRIDAVGYIEHILEICVTEKIKLVLSLIDPELTLLAKNKDRFLEIGTIVLVSDFDANERCFDKFQMFLFLQENGFNTPKCYLDKKSFFDDQNCGLVKYPVIVKPIKGSASLNCFEAVNAVEIEQIFQHYEDVMIQEHLMGVEYGADVYVDLISKKTVSVFTKEKIRMRAGETDKSRSIRKMEIFELIERFVKVSGLSGVIDIDIIEVNGDYYILEVNPRFGGGYPHAHECGVNFVQFILNNLQGVENEVSIGEYEEDVCMMKYNEVKIIKSK